VADTLLGSGNIRKMRTQLEGKQVAYSLPIGESLVPLNGLIGQTLGINYHGHINCVHCDRKINKSYNQGYCFPCFRALAECDSCIMSPEKCHFHLGTCRDEAWGEANCFLDHIVYLANSSGLKIGITRHTQVPTRWIDQGAVQAIPLLRTRSRYLSGLVEVVLKAHAADRTSWQTMLKNHVDSLSMVEEREKILALVRDDIHALQKAHGIQSIQYVDSEEVTEIEFPVIAYPTKVKSFNLDKEPSLQGKLMGIKGQYLIFDTGVINMRKYTGYSLELQQLS